MAVDICMFSIINYCNMYIKIIIIIIISNNDLLHVFWFTHVVAELFV